MCRTSDVDPCAQMYVPLHVCPAAKGKPPGGGAARGVITDVAGARAVRPTTTPPSRTAIAIARTAYTHLRALGNVAGMPGSIASWLGMESSRDRTSAADRARCPSSGAIIESRAWRRSCGTSRGSARSVAIFPAASSNGSPRAGSPTAPPPWSPPGRRDRSRAARRRGSARAACTRRSPRSSSQSPRAPVAGSGWRRSRPGRAGPPG